MAMDWDAVATQVNIFSPAHDGVLARCFLAANCAFWGMSGLCYALDSVDKDSSLGRFLVRHKVQGLKAYLSASDYHTAFSLSSVNMLFWAYLSAIGGNMVWRQDGCYGWYTPVPVDAPFEWKRELACLLGCAVVIDFWFYWTHRIMHWKEPINLYALVHKIHHRYKTPAAVCATYAHPFEFVVGNLMGVALGPVLTNSHPYTAYGWFVLTLVSTCGSHSGYGFLGAEKHDEHHEFFDWNFGVGPVCDQLFGTSLPKGYADASRAKSAAMLARREATKEGLGKSQPPAGKSVS